MVALLRGLVMAVTLVSTGVVAAPASLAEGGAGLSKREETMVYPRVAETDMFLVDRVTGEPVGPNEANHTCSQPMPGDSKGDIAARGGSSRCTGVLDLMDDALYDADKMLDKLLDNVPRVASSLLTSVRRELDDIIRPFEDAVRHYNKYGDLEGHGRDCHYLRRVDRYLPKVLDAMDQVQGLRSAVPAQYRLYVDAAFSLHRQLKKQDANFHRFVKHVCPSRH
jgi:hypothetical protein